MRITTRLRIISVITIAALVVLVPVLIWSFIEFKSAKNDYVLSDAISVNFFERAVFRDQYFLYREDRAQSMWNKSKQTAEQMLQQAKTQFRSEADQSKLKQLQKHIEDTEVIFHRIVKNTEVLKSSADNHEVYEELDRRLFSQMLLRAASVRDNLTALRDASSQRVEQTYRVLTIIIGLFAVTLALATVLVSIHLSKLLRKRLAPLHDGARIIADGNLNHRIEASGSDEFSELALSVNSMTDKIQSYTRQLEAEISAHQHVEIALRESEEKLQAILNAAEVAVAWANGDGTIEYVNPKFISLFGYSLDDVPTIEQWYLHAYPDADYRKKSVSEWNDKVARSLPDKRAIEPMELEITCKDGSMRHVILMGSWSGTRLLANFSDITGRKQAEIALRDSELRYRSLVENSPMCIHEIGMDGKLTSMNRAGLHMLGLEDECKVRGLLYLDAVCDADRARIGELLAKAYGGEASYFEFKSSGSRGQIFQSCFVPLKNSSGNVIKIMGITEDITERKRIEDRIRELNRDFVSFLENTSDYIYFKDANSRFRFCSQPLADITGHASWRDMIGKHDLEVFPPDTAQIYYEEELPVFREGKSLLNKIDPYYDASGVRGWVSTNKWPLLDHDGKVIGLFGISRDITESKMAEEKLQKSEASQRAILDNVPYLVWLKDTDGRFIAVNKAFFKTTGLAKMQDVLGKTDADLWPDNLAAKYRADDAEVMATRKQKLTEEMSMDNGEIHWVETFKAPIMDMNGNLLGTTGFAQDITARKSAEGKIRHLAHYDPLTDLPNRTLFSDRLQQALAAAKRDKTRMALMFLDLDKFKPVNDALGHHVGDLLLKEAAKRMQECVRESDTVARIGGDEFIILLPTIEAEQDAMLVADKIRDVLNQPFVLVGQSLSISSSTGIAVYPEHGKDETQLMKCADIAMYHAKEGGRNCVIFYQPDMQDGVQQP